MEVKVRVKGYLQQPDGNAAPIRQDFTIDARWGFVEFEYQGKTLRVALDNQYGVDGLEIMSPDGGQLTVHPIVSNVIIVSGTR